MMSGLAKFPGPVCCNPDYNSFPTEMLIYLSSLDKYLNSLLIKWYPG